MACLQIYRELLSLTTFLQVHSNSEEVSYLSWQNTYRNLKTACHIKLKFFMWSKLLENLLFAKYLISATVPLSKSRLLANLFANILTRKEAQKAPFCKHFNVERITKGIKSYDFKSFCTFTELLVQISW